ncbi:MAG: DEAD/DEAH box helicase, partial [Bacteroidetes bacterium]|nr:DEAD/DEAH box helicase [Candidatus Merdivivens pullicola]
MTDNFLDLGLSNELLNAVAELGFEKPTPVQARIIPVLLVENKDIVCLAQTGTGKTAAFGLPVLEYLDTNNPETQVLILSPTRELCRQITQDLENYSKYQKGVKIVSLYGGASIVTQMRQLRNGAHIIVATPGRLLDIIKRKEADISHINTLVLDEADEMLDMGFKDDLDAILASAPEERRSLLFSATLPKEVEAIARTYMKDPEIVTVGTRNAGSENVEHYYYMIREEDRYEALKRIADFNPDIYGIVFCKTREETQKVADALQRDGYDADALHGDLSQAQRDYVMGKFKRKALHLLVATDVAARGIDVTGLSHVINYNLPQEIELYTHRSGRTGRADRKGISIAIINQREKGKLRRIEQVIKKQFTRLPIPSAREICEKQLLHLINGINSVEVRKDIYNFLPLINEQWDGISKEELIEKMLSYEFNRFFDYYRKAKDINIQDKQDNKKSGIKKDEDTGQDLGRSRRESRKQKEKN